MANLRPLQKLWNALPYLRIIEELTKVPRSNELTSGSYMELRLDLDGRQTATFLRVPTFWDAINGQWIGALKLPNGKLIRAEGADSFALTNNFNKNVFEALQSDEEKADFFAMFKPLEFWDKKDSS